MVGIVLRLKCHKLLYHTFSGLSHEERVRPTLFPAGMPAILKQYRAQLPCFTTEGQDALFNVLERNSVKDNW